MNRCLVILFLSGLCLAVLLPGLGRLTMERQQELRVALVAKNMVESGNWLVPEFQNNPRLRKPPLVYWVTAAAFKAAGQTGSALVARIPSVISGTFLILVIYGFGARLMGRRRALLAATMAATSFLFIRHARLAETDITLVLFTTLSVWCAYRARFEEGAWWNWLGMGLFAGLGFLAKGPAAVAVPVLALLAGEGVSMGGDKKRWRPAWMLGALLLAVAVAAPWYIKILSLRHELPGVQETLGNELSDTFVETKHPGHLLYYVPLLPLITLPWGVLLPFAVVRFWRRARHHCRLRYLFGWWLVTMILLSVVTSKQTHYALLLLPATALLLGWYAGAQAWSRCLADSLHRMQPVRAGAWITAGFLIVSTYAYGVYPRFHAESLVPEFLQFEKARIAQAPLVHVVGINSAIFDFYTGRETHNIDTAQAAYDRADPGEIILVIAQAGEPHLTRVVGVQPLRERLHRRLCYRVYRK